VELRHDGCAVTDRASDALHRAGADVAHCKDARHAGSNERGTSLRPARTNSCRLRSTPVFTNPLASRATSQSCSHSVAGSAPTKTKTCRTFTSSSAPVRWFFHRTVSSSPRSSPFSVVSSVRWWRWMFAGGRPRSAWRRSGADATPGGRSPTPRESAADSGRPRGPAPGGPPVAPYSRRPGRPALTSRRLVARCAGSAGVSAPRQNPGPRQ
jgi:hypothetical protein